MVEAIYYQAAPPGFSGRYAGKAADLASLRSGSSQSSSVVLGCIVSTVYNSDGNQYVCVLSNDFYTSLRC